MNLTCHFHLVFSAESVSHISSLHYVSLLWYWIQNRAYLFNYSFSDCVQYKKWKSFANSSNQWFESVTVKVDIWLFTHVWVSIHPVICCCTVPAGCVSKPPNGEIGVPQKTKCPTRGSTVLSSLPRSKLILTVSTCLLVLLFLSAAFLLYRIGQIHNQFSENPIHTGRWVRCFMELEHRAAMYCESPDDRTTWHSGYRVTMYYENTHIRRILHCAKNTINC